MSWANLKEQIISNDRFTVERKEDHIRKVTYLETLIGDDIFFIGHPILQYYTNQAPWTRNWFNLLSERLEDLSICSNFETIIKRLKSTDKFYEVMSVIEVAHRLKKNGFEISIDSKVQVKKGRDFKEPDIKLVNKSTKENIYVEVSQSHTSREEKEANRTYEKLHGEYMYDREIVYYVKIHMSLSEPRLLDISKQIDDAIQYVRENKILRTIQIAGIIDAGFAPRSNKEKLDEWANERNISFSIEGPPIIVDELTRLKNKIRKEVEQLPLDSASIIFIQTPKVVFLGKEPRDILRELAEQVHSFPNLYCVIISGGAYFDGDEFKTEFDGNFYIRKCNPLLGYDDMFVIFNKYCNVEVTTDTQDKIRQAYI